MERPLRPSPPLRAPLAKKDLTCMENADYIGDGKPSPSDEGNCVLAVGAPARFRGIRSRAFSRKEEEMAIIRPALRA